MKKNPKLFHSLSITLLITSSLITQVSTRINKLYISSEDETWFPVSRLFPNYHQNNIEYLAIDTQKIQIQTLPNLSLSLLHHVYCSLTKQRTPPKKLVNHTFKDSPQNSFNSKKVQSYRKSSNKYFDPRNQKNMGSGSNSTQLKSSPLNTNYLDYTFNHSRQPPRSTSSQQNQINDGIGGEDSIVYPPHYQIHKIDTLDFTFLFIKANKIDRGLLNCLVLLKVKNDPQVKVGRVLVRVLESPTDLPYISKTPDIHIYHDSKNIGTRYTIRKNTVFGNSISLHFRLSHSSLKMINFDEFESSFQVEIDPNPNLQFEKFEMVNLIYLYIQYKDLSKDPTASKVLHVYKCSNIFEMHIICRKGSKKVIKISKLEKLLSVEACQSIQDFNHNMLTKLKQEYASPYIFIQEGGVIKVTSFENLGKRSKTMQFVLGDQEIVKSLCSIKSPFFKLMVLRKDTTSNKNSLITFVKNVATGSFYSKNLDLGKEVFKHYEWFNPLDIVKCGLMNSCYCVIADSPIGIQMIQLNFEFWTHVNEIIILYDLQIIYQNIISRFLNSEPSNNNKSDPHRHNTPSLLPGRNRYVKQCQKMNKAVLLLGKNTLIISQFYELLQFNKLSGIQNIDLGKYGIIEVVELICTDSLKYYVIVGRREYSQKPVLLIGEVSMDQNDSRVLIRNLDQLDSDFDEKSYSFTYNGMDNEGNEDQLILFTHKIKKPTGIFKRSHVEVNIKRYLLGDYEYILFVNESYELNNNLTLKVTQNRTFYENTTSLGRSKPSLDPKYTKMYSFTQNNVFIEPRNTQILIDQSSLKLPIAGDYNIDHLADLQGHIFGAEITSDTLSGEEIQKSVIMGSRIGEVENMTLEGVHLSQILFINGNYIIGVSHQKVGSFKIQTIFYLIDKNTSKIILSHTHNNRCKNFKVKRWKKIKYKIFAFCGGFDYSIHNQYMLVLRFRNFSRLGKWGVKKFQYKVPNYYTRLIYIFGVRYFYTIAKIESSNFEFFGKFGLGLIDYDDDRTLRNKIRIIFNFKQYIFSKYADQKIYIFYSKNKGSSMGIIEVNTAERLDTITDSHEVAVKGSNIQINSIKCDSSEGMLLSHCVAMGYGHKMIYFELHRRYTSSPSSDLGGGGLDDEENGFSIHNVTYCDIPSRYEVKDRTVQNGYVLVTARIVVKSVASEVILVYEPLVSRFVRWSIDLAYERSRGYLYSIYPVFFTSEMRGKTEEEIKFVYSSPTLSSNKSDDSKNGTTQKLYISKIQDLRLTLKKNFNQSELREYKVDMGQINHTIFLDEFFYPKEMTIDDNKVKGKTDIPSKRMLLYILIVLVVLVVLAVCVLSTQIKRLRKNTARDKQRLRGGKYSKGSQKSVLSMIRLELEIEEDLEQESTMDYKDSISFIQSEDPNL